MLLYDVSLSDYDLLIYPFCLLYHIDVVGLGPGHVTVPGTVEEFGDGFLV